MLEGKYNHAYSTKLRFKCVKYEIIYHKIKNFYKLNTLNSKINILKNIGKIFLRILKIYKRIIILRIILN